LLCALNSLLHNILNFAKCFAPPDSPTLLTLSSVTSSLHDSLSASIPYLTKHFSHAQHHTHCATDPLLLPTAFALLREPAQFKTLRDHLPVNDHCTSSTRPASAGSSDQIFRHCSCQCRGCHDSSLGNALVEAGEPLVVIVSRAQPNFHRLHFVNVGSFGGVVLGTAVSRFWVRKDSGVTNWVGHGNATLFEEKLRRHMRIRENLGSRLVTLGESFHGKCILFPLSQGFDEERKADYIDRVSGKDVDD
jgi:hypothetical protein